MGAGQFSPTSYEIIGRSSATSATLVTVSANASANVKGSYATIGTTTFHWSGFYLLVQRIATTGRWRLDVAINTGGSDAIIVEDFFIETTANGTSFNLWFPLRVPSGASVKVRVQCDSGGSTLAMAAFGYMSGPNGPPSYSRIISCTDFTSTDATNGVTLNGTTQTAWAQVVSSTALRIAGLYVSPSRRADAVRSNASLVVDIGRGAASSEIVTLQLVVFNHGATNMETVVPASVERPYFIDIPASTRLSVRAVADAATTDSFGVCLSGLVP